MAYQLAEGEALYRIGVNADCPVHGVCLAGQNFTRMSEKVSGYGAETVREPIRGSIVIMRKGQLEKCIEAAKHKLIRHTDGKRARARIVDTRNKRFRSVAGDLPVSAYVYAEKITPANNPHAEVKRPTFADMDTPEKAPEKAPAKAEKPAREESPSDFFAPKPKRGRPRGSSRK